MAESHQMAADSSTWRSELSQMDIWYATFGSNMWKPRFLCYIQGGQVDGMINPCLGSVDKNPPNDTLWKTVPHRLFFGRESTIAWGPGGVAFLHPERGDGEKAYLRLYRITLEQFNDVLFQENGHNDKSSPAFGWDDLDTVTNQGSKTLDIKGWYNNVVCLGKEQDIPILTMTCSLKKIDRFKSGEVPLRADEVPLRAPSKKYANTLIRGLVEGPLSKKEAKAYIKEASDKPL